jgi:hypothetical protein
MRLSVAFRRAAFRELFEAAEWYEERRAGLGIEFVAEIDRAVELLKEHPERFPQMHKDIRLRSGPSFSLFSVLPYRASSHCGAGRVSRAS